jgi:hypothetical protein
MMSLQHKKSLKAYGKAGPLKLVLVAQARRGEVVDASEE